MNTSGAEIPNYQITFWNLPECDISTYPHHYILHVHVYGVATDVSVLHENCTTVLRLAGWRALARISGKNEALSRRALALNRLKLL